LIAASQAVDLIVSEIRKITESAGPLGNVLPIMSIDDTLYFCSIFHCNDPQTAAANRLRGAKTKRHSNNA
jgi:hypothetical protein